MDVNKLETFIKRLPVPEQKRIILIAKDTPLSWIGILEELKNGGELAIEIEKKLLEKIK